MTQTELADAVGVSEQAVRKWELNRSQPRPATIEKLAELFELPQSAFNPYRSELTIAEHGNVVTIPQVTFRDIGRLSKNEILMSANAVRVEVGPSNEVQPGEFRMIIEEDSMAPLFNVGDIIRLSTTVRPYHGCQVVASVGDTDTAILRHYRERPGGSFDLWPDNPNFQTVTANDSTRIDIKGVVVRHVRVLTPPGR